MKIEARPKEGNRDILTLLVEGQEWKEIHIAVYGRHPTFSIDSSQENWQVAFEVLEYKKSQKLCAKAFNGSRLPFSAIEKANARKVNSFFQIAIHFV